MLYDANVSAAEVYTSASEAPMSYYDSLSGTCYNALTKLELKIQSGGSGVLTGVTAYLTTDAVNLVDLAGLKVGYGAAYTYVEEGTVRATSGRPGYIRGLPVLLAEGTSVRTGGLKLLPRAAEDALVPRLLQSLAIELVLRTERAAQLLEPDLQLLQLHRLAPLPQAREQPDLE